MLPRFLAFSLQRSISNIILRKRLLCALDTSLLLILIVSIKRKGYVWHDAWDLLLFHDPWCVYCWDAPPMPTQHSFHCSKRINRTCLWIHQVVLIWWNICWTDIKIRNKVKNFQRSATESVVVACSDQSKICLRWVFMIFVGMTCFEHHIMHQFLIADLLIASYLWSGGLRWVRWHEQTSLRHDLGDHMPRVCQIHALILDNLQLFREQHLVTSWTTCYSLYCDSFGDYAWLIDSACKWEPLQFAAGVFSFLRNWSQEIHRFQSLRATVNEPDTVIKLITA